LPEFSIYASHSDDGVERVTTGIVDAIAVGSDGRPRLVVDWKSDVDPGPGAIKHYRSQVEGYLEATDVAEGL